MDNELNYIKKKDNRYIILKSDKLATEISPNGIKPTSIEISCDSCTIALLIKILNGIENIQDEFNIQGKKYCIIRNSGNVFIEETREGNFTNIVGYSSVEIPLVIAELLNLKIEKNN